MHLLHFVNAYFPSTGGTVTRVHNLLHADGHRHTLVIPITARDRASFDDERLSTSEQVDNLRLIRVDVSAVGRGAWMPAARHEAQARALVEAVRDERPDILYGHNPLTCALASLGFDAPGRGIPFLYEAHGIMRDYSNARPGRPWSDVRDGLIQRVLGRYERRVIARADAIVAQTQAAARRIIELYGIPEDRFVVVPNGVDCNFFDPKRWAADREALRRARGWENQIVVFYAGYLDEVNGTAFLLGAVRSLPDSLRKRFRFVLAGRGPREPDVRRAADERPDLFEFLGTLAHDDMPRYYAATDVFVVPRPSYRPSETLLPMKLLEAMAMEKVVLVSSVEGMAEIVRDGETGLVYAKDDEIAFRQRLADIAEAGHKVANLDAAARRLVADRFQWSTSRASLDILYKRLTTATNPSVGTPVT